MICEQCDIVMESFSDNSVIGWRCPKCGWAIVTSNLGKIHNDIVEYSIYITNPINASVDRIKLVAKITNTNYLNAKKLLEEGNCCIYKGKAVDVKNIIEELIKVEINYDVCPSFEY
ncbi:MAG: hypothetical protein IJ661_13455 [Lachnospiraceae bacterium]|nr:hypothetical protein [Lachnospiraceae bacterium]